MTLGLERPLLLALIPLALLVSYALLRARDARPPAVLRGAALALLLLALAAPTAGLERPGLVVLVDVSDSAGPAPEALASLPAAAHLEFAGRAGPAGQSRLALEPGATDLAAALQVARAYRPARVLVASDGLITGASPLESLPGVPVDTLQLEPRPNARVVELLAPGEATPGATLRATAVIESSRAARARLLPSLGGRPLPAGSVQLPAGRSSWPVTAVVPGPGDLELELLIEVDYDQPTLDDRLATAVRASGQAGVLVIGDAPLARLLARQGFRVTEAAPERVREPLAFQAIAIRAAATSFTTAQHRLLQQYVQDGGGLLLTGGPQAFGLGGWYRTPVEASLPITSDLRTRVDVPLVALVMVVDRSLSMAGPGGGSGGGQKLALALEGAASVVELAQPRDLVGLLSFSDDPRWAFRPMRATDSSKLQMIRAIDGVQPEGGTVLEPAYREAIAALDGLNASVKHLVLLTDGQLADDQDPSGRPRPAPDFAAIARAARARGITTSSIAVGADADQARLRSISQAGGGRYYQALDAETLPRIFTTEALTATRSLVRDEPLRPEVARHPLAAGLKVSLAPTLTAYVATTLRASAEPILVGLDREPILSVARAGLGRTAALAADLGRDDPFTRWDALPGLIGTVVRWLQAPPQPYRLSLDASGRQVVLDAVEAGRYLDGGRFELRAGGTSVPMQQTAPGRYEADLPAGTRGQAVVAREGRPVARVRVEPQDRELAGSGGASLLRQVAAASGGRSLATLDGYDAASTFERTPLAPWVALLAALALVLELAYRRLRL